MLLDRFIIEKTTLAARDCPRGHGGGRRDHASAFAHGPGLGSCQLTQGRASGDAKAAKLMK